MTDIDEPLAPVLPRELTDISDAVRAVGAPPTLVLANIFELEPHCRRIMFDPDHRNAGARAVCEHAKCVFLGEHDMANRRMALYALPRTPQDAPPHRG